MNEEQITVELYNKLIEDAGIHTAYKMSEGLCETPVEMEAVIIEGLMIAIDMHTPFIPIDLRETLANLLSLKVIDALEDTMITSLKNRFEKLL